MKATMQSKTSRGFTLIELMVGLTIGLLTVLIIVEVFTITRIRSRQVAGGNDAQQVASIVGYQIGSALRQAGSNLNDPRIWGCELGAQRGSNSLVPPSSWPSPFSSLPGQLRVAPAVIYGATSVAADSRESDILLVMGGDAETSNAFSVRTDVGDQKLLLENSNGIFPGDYVLLGEGTVGKECKLFQVAPSLSTTYAAQRLDDTAQAVPLAPSVMVSGSLASAVSPGILFDVGASPKWYLLGVDPANQVLKLYDLLQLRNAGTNGTAVSLGENIFLLRFLYRVVDAGGGLEWKSPRDSGWTFGELQNGTDAATKRMQQIKALRFALVTKTSYPDSSPAPASFTLFSSMGASFEQSITLTADEQRYRYQIYEITVPLYNLK